MADESRRIDIGFQGGPVLPARVKQSSYDELHKALSKDRSDRWFELETDRLEGLDRPVAGRLRPHRHRRAAGRLLGRPWTALSCDCCARAATRPRSSGRRSCTPGQGSTGAAGSVRCWRAVARRPPRGPGWCSPLCSRTRRSSRWCAGRAPMLGPGLPPLAATLSGLSYPSAHAATSFAAAARFRRCPRCRCTPRPGRWRCRGPTSACTTLRRARRRGARRGAGRSCREDRHRRAAQRGQVVALQRAHARRRAGGQLPVHHARAERGGGRRARRAPRPGRRDGGRHAGRARGDRVPRHRRAGARRASRARGWATGSSATSARPTRSCTSCAPTSDAQVVHPEGRVDPLADVETIETELLYADLEQAERRLERVAKQAKSGDKELIAEERWLARGRRRAARGRPVRTVPAARWRPGRRDAAVGPHLQAGALRGERGRGRAARAAGRAGGARAGARRARRGGQRAPGVRAGRARRRRGRGDARRSWASRESGLATVIREAFELLHLISFFTAGQGKEARARAIARGTRPGRRPGRCTPTSSAASWPPRSRRGTSWSDAGGYAAAREQALHARGGPRLRGARRRRGDVPLHALSGRHAARLLAEIVRYVSLRPSAATRHDVRHAPRRHRRLSRGPDPRRASARPRCSRTATQLVGSRRLRGRGRRRPRRVRCAPRASRSTPTARSTAAAARSTRCSWPAAAGSTTRGRDERLVALAAAAPPRRSRRVTLGLHRRVPARPGRPARRPARHHPLGLVRRAGRAATPRSRWSPTRSSCATAT